MKIDSEGLRLPGRRARLPNGGSRTTTDLPIQALDRGPDPAALKEPGKRSGQRQHSVPAPLPPAEAPGRVGGRENGTPVRLVSLENGKTEVAEAPPAGFAALLARAVAGNPGAEVWKRALVEAREPSQDQLALPFPYIADAGGMMEQNDARFVVQGLKSLGADVAARGILENWLDLGERCAALPGSNSFNELGRSGMPVLSSLLREEAATHPDPEFLPRAYAVLSDDYENSWSDGYFKRTATGLNRFCDVDYSHDATLIESGGEKNRERFEHGDPLPYNPVDLNAYLYRTEKDLAEMARQMAERSREEPALAQDWKDAAQEWELRAAQRKDRMLATFWQDGEGFPRDWNYQEGRPASPRCLAAFSLLDAGVLDLSVPRERRKIEELIGALPDFVGPDGMRWVEGSSQQASPRDLAMVVSGLRRYQRPSAELEAMLAQAAAETPPDLGARAMLSQPVDRPTDPPELPTSRLEAWMAPVGAERLRLVAQHTTGADSVTVRPVEAGRIDRRLRRLDPSLLQPAVMEEIAARGLNERIYGVRFQGADGARLGEIPTLPETTTVPDGRFRVGTQAFDFGAGTEVSFLQPGVAVVRNGPSELTLVQLQDGILIGDRVYPNQPERVLRLPRHIFGNFSRAGGNPQLEAYFQLDPYWQAPPGGPRSTVQSLPHREGWRRLNELVERNWERLTIGPSVVPRDTACQYFNAAAVPSLGIFKTQFNWDSMFMSKGMQLQGHDETVAGMTDNLLYLRKTTGRVPNAARWIYANKSQPPFLPTLVRFSVPIRERTDGPEETREWMREAYDLMGRDYRDFWCKSGPGQRGIPQIDGREVRLSRYGGPNHKFAMDESGFDTTSRFDGRTLDLVPPDLNAYLWLYSREMAAIARQLADESGIPADREQYRADAGSWEQEAARRKADVIDFCWDSRDGLFRDYRFQGDEKGLVRDQDALSAAAAPLWVGMLDPDKPREREMIERSLDSLERFEKEHGLAATAQDYGHPEMQWNAPSGWSPLHMMAIEAATRYGRHDQAARWTAKWLDTVERMQRTQGAILERYDMETGGFPPVQKGRYEETQGKGPGFGWTNASVPWALIEVVGGLRLEREPGQPVTLQVRPHIPEQLRGEDFTVEFADPGGKGTCRVTHRYDGDAYSARIQGHAAEKWDLVLETPPLPPGPPPEVPGASVETVATGDGRVRHRLRLQGLSGDYGLDLRFE